jgi:hypothetical protein
VKGFAFTSFFLGDKWAPGGVLDPNMYLALVTIHGTIMVFFVLTGGLSGTFANLLIPLQLGARDMASGFINMLSYWFFFVSSIIMLASLFVEGGPASAGWTIYPPLSSLPKRCRVPARDDPLVGEHDAVHRQCAHGRPQLRGHHHEPADQGHEDDADAADDLGALAYGRDRYPHPSRCC